MFTAALFMLAVAPGGTSPSNETIPYFARRYGVDCQTCHVIAPRLNAFGEGFRRNGYQSARLVARSTWPVAVWASGRFDALPSATEAITRGYLNRLEIIAGGRLVAPWLSYFVEWRAVSFEARGDGTLRDRSGRFEDLYLTAATQDLAVTVGQFRQVDQTDVSLRLSLSEPLVLAAGLPAPAGTPPGTRHASLSGFAPAGRSPAVRVAVSPQLGTWRWTSSVAVPLPGELSIPITDSARVEASNEIFWDPKGVVLESFVRRGLTSYGAHAFIGSGDRLLVNAVVAGRRASVYWTTMAGLERAAGTTYARWSAEGEFLPGRTYGIGARVENRGGDGASPALLPYIVAHFPGTRYTLRLAIEQRLQRDRETTLFELGLVF